MQRGIFQQLFILVPVFLFATAAQAQEDLEGATLEDILNVNTKIASNTTRSLREQPGIVSVITAEEIYNSGARDLIDVLRLVPGFDFAHDVLGHNSWAFRGQWAMEGKIALIVDGRVYNDPAWGNVVFGNRFPVDLIERIEIIRGPGSAKYGGYAELAVVNVTTKGAGTKGVFTSGAYGQMQNGMGRAQLNAVTGNKTDNMRYSAAVFGAQGHQSDQIYTDAAGLAWDMADNSDFQLMGANLSFGMGGFDSRIIIDNYQYESENLYGGLFSNEGRFTSEHKSQYIGLEYGAKLGDDFTLTPKVSYLEEVQHKITMDRLDSGYPSVLGTHYYIPTTRTTGSLNGLYEFNKDANVIFGYEYISTEAESSDFNGDWNTVPAPTYLRGGNKINYHQNSVYLQGEHFNPFVNVTAGGRWAEHSGTADSVFVPRLAFTKVIEPWGFKLMYSKAFRMGDVEHINLSRGGAAVTAPPVDLKPELTTVTEFETSYALNPHNLLSLNLYAMKIEDAITYSSNNTTQNAGELKSKGAELEWKLSENWGTTKFNVSHYIGDSGSAPNYRDNTDEKAYLGLPRTKVAALSDVKLIGSMLTVSPSVVHFTKKYGRNKNIGGVETEFEDVTLVSVFLNYRPLAGLTTSLGVHDLLGENYKFVQAYDNGIPAQPGPSREIMAKVSYSYNF